MELDRKDLKIRALLEKVNNKEEEVADLRVELTILQAEKERDVKRLTQEIGALQNRLNDAERSARRTNGEFEVIEGEVIEEEEEKSD